MGTSREKRQAAKGPKVAKTTKATKPLTTEERKEKRNRLSTYYTEKEKKEEARQEKYKKLANDILNKYKITTPATLKETDPTAYAKYQQHKRNVSGSQSKIKKYQKYQEKIVQDDLDDFLDDDLDEIEDESNRQGPSTEANKEKPAEWNQEDENEADKDDEDKIDENNDGNRESDTEDSDMGEDNDNNNDREEGEIEMRESDEESSNTENPNNIQLPIQPGNAEDSVVTNSFINSFGMVTGQVRDNMMDGDPEGPHKYMSKIQFFKQELSNCNGKMTLSFKNRKIKNSKKNKTKEYADPLEAINDGVEPCEILNSFLRIQASLGFILFFMYRNPLAEKSTVGTEFWAF